MNKYLVLVAQGVTAEEVQDLRQAREEDCQSSDGGTSSSTIGDDQES